MLIALSSTSAVSLSYTVLQQLEKKLCCQPPPGVAQTHVVESRNTHTLWKHFTCQQLYSIGSICGLIGIKWKEVLTSRDTLLKSKPPIRYYILLWVKEYIIYFQGKWSSEKKSSSLFCPSYQFYCCSNRGSLYMKFSLNRKNEYKHQPQTEKHMENSIKMCVQVQLYGSEKILTLF